MSYRFIISKSDDTYTAEPKLMQLTKQYSYPDSFEAGTKEKLWDIMRDELGASFIHKRKGEWIISTGRKTKTK